MKKINVLQLLTTSDVRGSENLVVSMVERGDTDKFNYFICSLYPVGDLQQLAVKKGIKCSSLGVRLNFISAVFRLWRLLSKYEIDIVHVYGFRTDLLCRIVLPFVKAKVLISAIHSVHSNCPKAVFIVDKLFSPFVDLYVSNSIAGAQFHQLRSKISKNKYSVIYSGVNMPVLNKDANRSLSNILDGSFIITLMAGITGEKGHDVAIEAFVKIKERFPQKEFKLVFVGKDFTGGVISELADKKKTSNDVIFLGFSDAKIVQEVMETTDVFILPSLREGLPTVVLEAMSYGLPVVATDVGGTAELLVNGETGFLIKPSDVDSLADKVSTLVKDEAQRLSMGKSGRELVENNFSLGQMTSFIEEKYLELYQPIKIND